MLVGNPPCKDCKNRELGCHSKCEQYVNWRKLHIEEKQRLREEFLINKASKSTDDIMESCKRSTRRAEFGFKLKKPL